MYKVLRVNELNQRFSCSINLKFYIMRKIGNLFFAIFTVFWFQSCGVVSLDEQVRSESIQISTSEYPMTEADLMIALANDETKKWEATGFTMQLIDNFQSCRLDDVLSLNNNGTYNYDGGNVLCGAEDNERLKSGVWELNYQERKLIFDRGTSEEVELYIEEASDTKVIVSSTYMQLKVVGRYEIGS